MPASSPNVSLGHTIVLVEALEAAVHFYSQWLGDAITFRWQREAFYVEGRLGVAAQERVLAFVTQQGLQAYLPFPNHWGYPAERGVLLSLETDNVQTLYKQGLASGAISLAPPRLMPWQQAGHPRQSAFLACPFGLWWELTGFACNAII
jgi:catechol 2,3-dioxygenase-like lactoylglutathione lyase family enzyme